MRLRTPGVNIAVVAKDETGWKFLIVKRSESETYPGRIGFVTGMSDDSETVTRTAIRELAEETGLTANSLWTTEHLIQFYEPYSDSIWFLPVLVAIVNSESKVSLCPENCEYFWLDYRKAQQKVNWKNLVHILNELQEELERFPASSWIALPV